MDILITSAEAKAGRRKLTNRTYRSVRPGDILDFGSGEVRYREAAGYGTYYGRGFEAYVDVRVVGGIAPCWIEAGAKFTIWRKAS